MAKTILVAASTFPASATDTVPAFVKDQIIALKMLHPEDTYAVVAPHDTRSHTVTHSIHDAYDEHRFHYAWPHSFEKLAGHGILPALRANPLYYLLVPCLFIAEFFAIWRVTRRLRPDLLYAHWFTPQAVTMALVSKLTGVPFVYTTHAADVSVWHKIPGLGDWIVRTVTKRARTLTAVSRRSLSKLEQFFSPQQWQQVQTKAAIIPMGVDTEDFAATRLPKQELRKEYKLTDEKVLFFIGRLAEKKGVTYLLQAFASLRATSPSIRLIIGGDGPLRSSLEAEARNLGISEAVSFVGFLSGQDKNDYFHLADIFVMPSIITDDGDAEGMPVVLMEALASGQVCVATNESGADDILEDGRSGFLVVHKDTAALKTALHTALNLPEAEARAMRVAAQHTAAQFSWPAIAKRYWDLFIAHSNSA